MRKPTLSTESPTFKMLTETGLFQILDQRTQTDIIRNMIDDHNQKVAKIFENAGC